MTKVCSTCRVEQWYADFYSNRRNPDGLSYTCITCQASYYRMNKFKIETVKKEYRKANKPKIKLYLEVNRDRTTRTKVAYKQRRKETDMQYKLAEGLRGRLWSAIRFKCKMGSAVRDLGCSIDFFKQHLESQFTEGMSWENWGVGRGNWHIDHIMPLAAFDLTDRQHLILACHYGNLQPLWAEHNWLKSDKIPLTV